MTQSNKTAGTEHSDKHDISDSTMLFYWVHNKLGKCVNEGTRHQVQSEGTRHLMHGKLLPFDNWRLNVLVTQYSL